MDRIEVSQEVSKFLDRRRRDYETFLDDVVRDLKRAKDEGSLPGVYQIYTRADKQPGGAKTKSQVGIVKKLADWRFGADGNPETSPSEIHDIIGLTVVVYFSSEVSQTCDEIERRPFDSFSMIDRREKKEEGYFAEHMVVARKSLRSSTFTPLCEIQVKTLLHDGWAAKTHDLIYKPTVRIDPKIKAQNDKIGEMLQNLEEQSDSLRSMINQAAEDDRFRRNNAVVHLSYEMTKQHDDDASILSQICEQITDNKDHLATCYPGDPLFEEIKQGWKKQHDLGAEKKFVCRCILLLAVIRERRDLDADALEVIDHWVRSSSDREKAVALAFEAQANWILGQFEDAVNICKQSISLCEEMGFKTNGKLNLAYYMSEKAFVERKADEEEFRSEVHELVESVEMPKNVRQALSHKDTIGAIKIMTASTRDEIFKGRNLCDEARKESAEKGLDAQLFESFYALHEHRATRRLNELTD